MYWYVWQLVEGVGFRSFREEYLKVFVLAKMDICIPLESEERDGYNGVLFLI